MYASQLDTKPKWVLACFYALKFESLTINIRSISKHLLLQLTMDPIFKERMIPD